MGASISWLATDCGEFSSISDLLGLSQESDGTEGSIVGTRCDDGRLFMFETRNRGWTFATSNLRSRLSTKREMFFCTYDTRVMASSCALWRNGAEVWEVYHSADDGEFHLSVSGSPPSSLVGYKTLRIEKQKSVEDEDGYIDELIEVPLDLSIEFTRYHPEDDDYALDGQYFTLYEPKRPSLWSRLFGSE